jgi:hypothetical protein
LAALIDPLTFHPARSEYLTCGLGQGNNQYSATVLFVHNEQE